VIADLTCPKCEGHGFISGMAGCSGYGDPEEETVTEECSCFAGTLRCGVCGREEAVAIVADGTAEGMPVGEKCQLEQDERVAACMALVPGQRCANYWNHCCETCEGRRAIEERAAKFGALDRAWLAAGAEIRAARAGRGAA